MRVLLPVAICHGAAVCCSEAEVVKCVINCVVIISEKCQRIPGKFEIQVATRRIMCVVSMANSKFQFRPEVV